MDVFKLREALIDDYEGYINSFIRIRDEEIRTYVDERLEQGALWPEPLIQLNPTFEPGDWIDELVEDGTLHKECARIFRIKPGQADEGRRLRLHKHQSEAVRVASGGHNYVLTTGTGSGKSLAYIVPIVDHVLRTGSGRGIQAIVVYPMNALANSQYGELTKFLEHGYPEGKPPVTFAIYTGQERDETRERILANPPDILLTNYVMLELILTRPVERRKLAKRAQGLSFFVLDELHTYRGRQGADVALLVRRVREALDAPGMQCVGTSATLASGGTLDEQRAEVARVASQLFGTPVIPDHVIGETLRRATPDRDIATEAFRHELAARVGETDLLPPVTYDAFVDDPISIWIETTFGVERDPATGRLKRTKPKSIGGEEGAADRLAIAAGQTNGRCVRVIQDWLLAGYACEPDPETGRAPFAFRLHQFINRGDAVYASFEHSPDRHITVEPQKTAPGRPGAILLPLAFCRECGEAYYAVRRVTDSHSSQVSFVPRDLGDKLADQNSEAGFLHLSATDPWPSDPEAIQKRLPDDWLEDFKGTLRVKAGQKKNLPQPLAVTPGGFQDADGLDCHYVKAPFRFCLNCGVSYSHTQSSDFGKLSSLGAGGRSTATTILSLSTIRQLRQEPELSKRARKLLSFTDNRQDASLQAGHFNDFIEIGVIRSALYAAAVHAGEEGIKYDDLAQRVFDTLDLPIEHYATDPKVKYQALIETQRALRNVVSYRLYRDLKRGWRVTSPNLEQCGLLEIRYLSLEEVCADNEVWSGCHETLASATAATRAEVAKVLLDWMRRELAIRTDVLDPAKQEALRQQSDQRLKWPWALDEQELLEYATAIYPRPSRQGDDSRVNRYLSPRGGFGQYLRRKTTFADFTERLTLEATQQIILDLLAGLRVAGLVEPLGDDRVPDSDRGYQIPASVILWTAGSGKQVFNDPIRMPRESKVGSHANDYFIRFYKGTALGLLGVEAREHTAQVPNEERLNREQRFREGTLQVLYCSPTMELGVDISELNVVNLRNIPPTPANYAQRSGRAGRSGQPALVVAYCTTGSPHDQYFFKRPGNMVAGEVTPPRLDLANEDLVRAHVNAIWLAETDFSLGKSLKDLLDVAGNSPSLELLSDVQAVVADPEPRRRARESAARVLETIANDLRDADWYDDGWLDLTLESVDRNFEAACERWRDLYSSALRQAESQNRVILDASRSAEDKKQAHRLRREAEAQLSLLTSSDSVAVSDFYSYRYFASEGFLPGYSFPRLPLSAFIPGRKGRGSDEFVSRPRFLAISEFGPRAVIYHEGSRYTINKVILPVGEEDVLTSRAKQCESCGYVHPIKIGDGLDRCEHCDQPLDLALNNLLRLQNVATRRRDRINSDEEERLRLGYEIRTGLRFAEHDGEAVVKTAKIVSVDGEALAGLTYGHAATLWRMNLGWKRRANKNLHGFVLDQERGFWARDEHVEEGAGGDDPLSARTKRVIPYVEDRRNCLVLDLGDKLEVGFGASLRAAFKSAIQVEFQLEDAELAAEPLPDGNKPRSLLFYEAAEGGAGVLRRLVDDPNALARVARRALEICHFDPETGADRRRAPQAKEDCEEACYNCLMSYYNQPDHGVLNRNTIHEQLLAFAKSVVRMTSAPSSREGRAAMLRESPLGDLETRWIAHLDAAGHRLPSVSGKSVDSCNVRPDFLYEPLQAAIYVDGEDESRRSRVADALEDYGWTVVRFGPETTWGDTIARFPSVFGEPAPSRRRAKAASAGDGGDLDLDLFDERWHPLISALASQSGFVVDCGSDAVADGRVVGTYVAEVRVADRGVRVVDVADLTCDEVAAALESDGWVVVRADSSAIDAVVAAVIETLGGEG